MASSGKGFAQADGSVPVAINTNRTTRSSEAGGLPVDGEQDVGVGKHTAIPNHQTRVVVRDDLPADVERGACHGVGHDGVHHQERQRPHGDARQVGAR